MTQKEVFETYEGFSLIGECTAADSVSVKKFRSSRTGLTVILAGVPGPVVYGTFIVATEAKDDDGLPHTLEHLIFLGSLDYPYKGTLDIIANRCLARGTNAWTYVDHTAYTVSTAGSEGFLTLLPVYLDHLFFPTLTDAAFVTEVYHVTEEGKDSGVVFCEMLSLESNDEYLTYMELQRALYKRDCGYRYDTGGAVCNLRYCINNEKIRKFHRQFYCPLNTTIIVAGSVDEAKLIDVCYSFEEKLLNAGLDCFEKAWQNPVAPLEKPIIRAITYPCDQEDNGHVMVGWQGPSVVNKYYHVVALQILFTYLTETAASPLMKHFVETKNAYCSNISLEIIENSAAVISLMFENVVIEKMPFLHDELMNLLQKIADNKEEDFKINRTRMISVIQKFALKQLLGYEKKPQTVIAMTLIRNALYGNSVNDMYDRLNLHIVAKKLLAEPTTFWLTLLVDYFLCKPSACVLAYPWKNEHIVRAYFENERLGERQITLGEVGLKKYANILQKATEENMVLPPNELLATISVPPVDNFKFHSISRYTTTSEIQHPDLNITSTPLFVQLDDVDSKFVYAYVILNTSELPESFGIYLPLFLQYILECPIIRHGEFVSHEQVAGKLEEDLITIQNGIGLFNDKRFSYGPYDSTAMLSIVMTQENFEIGLQWIKSLLYDSVFTLERMQVIIQKLISSISQIRRQGNEMVKHLAKLMFYDSKNFHLCTVLVQLKFLTDLNCKIQQEEEFKQLVKNLEVMRSILTNPKNMILHISTNISKLVTIHANASCYLSKVIPENLIPNQNRMQVPHDYEFLSAAISNCECEVKSCVVGMATEDSYFMLHATKSITDFYNPDLPSVLVFLEYLIQTEGPLWRNIRGYGLAYHYNILLNPNEGILQLYLFRSTDIVQAFRRTKEIMNESIETAGSWNYVFFESAKGSLISRIVERERNISSVSRESVLTYFRGTTEDYNKTLIQKIQNVTSEDMKSIAEKYIRPLLDPKTTLSAIVCHNSKYEEVARRFSEMGFELKTFSSLEHSYISPSFINLDLENINF